MNRHAPPGANSSSVSYDCVLVNRHFTPILRHSEQSFVIRSRTFLAPGMASSLRCRVSTAGLAPVARRYITASSRYFAHAAQSQPILESHHQNYIPPFPSPAPEAKKMSPSTPFLEALKSRRTYYALTAKSPIPDSKIQEIINEVILHVPSSFNSQSTRIVLLLKTEHEKLWDITADVLKEIVPAEQYTKTEAKMGAFRAAYGTVFLPPPLLSRG